MGVNEGTCGGVNCGAVLSSLPRSSSPRQAHGAVLTWVCRHSPRAHNAVDDGRGDSPGRADSRPVGEARGGGPASLSNGADSHPVRKALAKGRPKAPLPAGLPAQECQAAHPAVVGVQVGSTGGADRLPTFALLFWERPGLRVGVVPGLSCCHRVQKQGRGLWAVGREGKCWPGGGEV